MSPGKRITRASLALALIAVVVLIPKALSYYAGWQQKRFDQACGEVRAAGGDVLSNDPYTRAATPDAVRSIILLPGLATMDVHTAAHLKPQLERFRDFDLDLTDRTFQPGAFAQWAGLSNVRTIKSTALTDAELPLVAQFPKLQAVALSGSQITDSKVASLGIPASLRCVVLFHTSATSRAAAVLQAASPRLAVFLPSLDLSSGPKEAPFKAEETSKAEETHDAKDMDTFTSRVVHVDDKGNQIWASNPFPNEYAGPPVWDDQRAYQPRSDGIAAYDVHSGKLLWLSPGLSCPSVLLDDGRLLLTAVPRSMPQAGQKPRPAEVAVRSTADGKLMFDVQLPLSDDFDENEDALKNASFVRGNSIFLYVRHGPKGADQTLVLDSLTGSLRFRIDALVIDAQPFSDGQYVCQTPGDVRGLHSNGSTAWLLPVTWGGAEGQLISCPGGDLIGMTYNHSGQTYTLVRVDPHRQAIAWQYTSPQIPSNHFVYALYVRMEIRRGLVALTRDGTDGQSMTVLEAATGSVLLRVR